jgi:hypothetical protein
MNAERMRAAVVALLDACYASEDDPVSTLHAELDRLCESGQWSQSQLAQLQLMTLERVKSIGG